MKRNVFLVIAIIGAFILAWWVGYNLYDKDAVLSNKNSIKVERNTPCLLYTSPSPRDLSTSRMPSSA